MDIQRYNVLYIISIYSSRIIRIVNVNGKTMLVTKCHSIKLKDLLLYKKPRMLKHSQLIKTLHKDFNALQALFIVKMNRHFSEAHMNKFIQHINLLMHNITLGDPKIFEISIKRFQIY